MGKTRRILVGQCVLALGLSLAAAVPGHASVTKVGNGDDGADLEALSPIQSGVIWESRAKAIEAVDRLNVRGVAGLGLLIPELERSDLLMAAKDVHPTGEQAGAIEISSDRNLVYARTFAEPYAATRFFPAAQKLTSEQLIALHIHEALHRSLPSDIRTNEDVVMHLTMAITSPGASFDRIRNVASLYIKAPVVADAPVLAAPIAMSSMKQKVVLPAKSRSRFGYEYTAYGLEKFSTAEEGRLHGFEFATSLGGYRSMKSLVVEPVFRARIKLTENRDSLASDSSSLIGPSSYDIEGKVRIDERTSIGPFARFTAKSLSDYGGGRDIITLGGVYRSEADKTYFESSLAYSLPSTTDSSEVKVEYKSILSLAARAGWKMGLLRLGGLAELHNSSGKDVTIVDDDYGTGLNDQDDVNPFRILLSGAELGVIGRRVQFKTHYKWIFNDTSASLCDLGVVIDRGAGRAVLGSSVALE
ncbi:MAG TPA: hypothetical protein VM432_12545, partial [Bdellovibrionales bacterium]|nr:hypothetical protein [Bdellovibrionales bacterium]